MKSMMLGLLAATLLAGTALAGEPPAMGDMAGMPGMGPMRMAAMPAAYAGEADKPGAPVFTGLGAHKHPISTKVAETQKFFDQGVNLMFGFNHAEAIRSFREAARLDPDCAMCWWGVAFALGPNINMPMPDDAVAPAWQALGRAVALEDKASPLERAWIEALRARYAEHPPADRHALDEAFAAAMGALWKAHPEDLDAGTFYAEAMMDTQPWDYWQLDGVTPKGHALEIVATLERIIKRAPDHPGALHLYIHAVEATTTPERAEAAADRLETLMPQAGHVVHMPSHIYYRVGRYRDAAKVNEAAALVDEAYIAACNAQGYYPVGYYGHNIHFLWTSSEMEGRYQASIDASRRLVAAIGKFPGANDMRASEWFEMSPIATLVRFGRWDAVLAEPKPPEAHKLQTAVWLYAQGFAHANKGDLAAAKADREALGEIATKTDFDAYAKENVPAHAMADVALALLDGEISRLSGNLTDAIGRFRLAWTLEQALPYNEPPNWHQPSSHLLGAALLQAHRAAEAEAVYRQSLKTYRGDGWALHGLALALDAEGKTAEAAQVRKAFTEAWQLADVTPETSRF
jgi:tetratricopeptide (TPR) repeat protein